MESRFQRELKSISDTTTKTSTSSSSVSTVSPPRFGRASRAARTSSTTIRRSHARHLPRPPPRLRFLFQSTRRAGRRSLDRRPGTNGQNFDISFDTVFDTQAKLPIAALSSLMAIPFRSLRFASTDPQTWGILLDARCHRNNESSFWPQYSSRLPGRLNQEGRRLGLEQISPGRNLQLIPYGIFRSFKELDLRDPYNPAYTQRAAFGQIGLDAKVVLKDKFVLDATANPDFSQVESDEPQVTVNQRFEVQFPEKRPFFLENANYFQDAD